MRRIELGRKVKVNHDKLVRPELHEAWVSEKWQEDQFWLQYFLEDHGCFPTSILFCRCRRPAVYCLAESEVLDNIKFCKLSETYAVSS